KRSPHRPSRTPAHGLRAGVVGSPILADRTAMGDRIMSTQFVRTWLKYLVGPGGEEHTRRRSRPWIYRPRLEVLEDRCCPSCATSVVDGHILQIVGETATRIDIVDTSTAVVVTCDDEPEMTFTGIDQIMVNANSGDDAVSYRFDPVPSAARGRPANLFVDLGA